MDYSECLREPPQHDHDDSNLTFADQDGDNHPELDDVTTHKPASKAGGKRGRGRQRNSTPFVEILTYKDETSGLTYSKGGTQLSVYFIICNIAHAKFLVMFLKDFLQN